MKRYRIKFKDLNPMDGIMLVQVFEVDSFGYGGLGVIEKELEYDELKISTNRTYVDFTEFDEMAEYLQSIGAHWLRWKLVGEHL